MSRRVDLPDGGWADVAERKELSVRERRRVERRMAETQTLFVKLAGDEGSAASLTEVELDKLYALQNQTICGLVRGWSRGELPTMENIEELPSDVYDELAAAVSQPDQRPSFDASADADPVRDAADPTSSSSGLNSASPVTLPVVK